MTKGTRVGWTLKSGEPGTGTVISDEENAHVLVAVDPLDADDGTKGPPYRSGTQSADYEFHRVIWCTVTWLTVLA